LSLALASRTVTAAALAVGRWLVVIAGLSAHGRRLRHCDGPIGRDLRLRRKMRREKNQREGGGCKKQI
jgi:hypothetical protein